MIILSYPNDPKEVEEWKDMLENLSISFQIQKDPTSEEIYLKEGKGLIKGSKQMRAYIDTLERDVREWCKCVCD